MCQGYFRDILVYQRVLVLGVDSHAKGYLNIFPQENLSEFRCFCCENGRFIEILVEFSTVSRLLGLNHRTLGGRGFPAKYIQKFWSVCALGQ